MISIVIPTRNSGLRFREALQAIREQDIDDQVEIVVVDSESTDATPRVAAELGARVIEIPAAEFGHGRTRNLAVSQAKGEIIVFTVDDAKPADSDWLRRLTAPLRKPDGPAATYSRQIPRAGAPPHQQIYIEYRFGPTARLQRAAAPEDLTLRTTQFSHVASATTAELLARHPLAEDIVVGEDGEWCARILLAGHTVRYTSDSVVEHSHDYSPIDAFRRYFDLGASAERTFLAAGRSTASAVRGEGLRFARDELGQLWRSRQIGAIPSTLIHEAVRWAAFQIGVRYRWIPPSLRPWLSGTPSHWRRLAGTGP